MQHLNLKSILKTSDSGFLKHLPGFVISVITLIIHQKRINNIIEKYKDYEGVDFLPKIIEELELNVEIEGLENLPESGKCFFVANHPFGFIDGLILTNTIGAKYGRLQAIGNEVFNYVPNLRPLISYVSVFGKTPKEYYKILDKIYHSDFPITHFPSGLVSRKENGKIQDSIWHKSFVTKSVSCQRDIVPFFFYGRNSRLFYFIFSTRKLLRIKANIELILLPHEMFRKKGKSIKVRIGKPVSWQTFDKSYNHKVWAEKLRQHQYNLEKAPSADFEFNP